MNPHGNLLILRRRLFQTVESSGKFYKLKKAFRKNYKSSLVLKMIPCAFSLATIGFSVDQKIPGSSL